MATTGSVDVNVTKFGNIVNNATELGADVTGGIADQGDLIGLAIGVSIALGLLIGLAIGALLIIPMLMKKIGKVKSSTRM